MTGIEKVSTARPSIEIEAEASIELHSRSSFVPCASFPLSNVQIFEGLPGLASQNRVAPHGQLAATETNDGKGSPST